VSSNENLEIVEIHLESVHGILTRCHFTDLVRAVRQEHPTLLDVVTSILGQRYGTYTQWRLAARQHASASTIGRWIGVRLAPALVKATIRYVLKPICLKDC
jgi:hypothetical protein